MAMCFQRAEGGVMAGKTFALDAAESLKYHANLGRRFDMKALGFASVALLVAGASASGQVFAGGMPGGYSCTAGGFCGTTTTPNYDVGAVPSGSARVGYVTTMFPGTNFDDPLSIGGETTNGSQLYSNVFTGTTGQNLSFWFNYITSDGADFADFAYVQLIGGNSGTTTLFTARTTSAGSTVPGFDMPEIAAGVLFSPLLPVYNSAGSLFGVWGPGGLGYGDPAWEGEPEADLSCFGTGCGHTGWIRASYQLTADDSYQLMFGVNNYIDNAYESAMLFDYGEGEGGTPTTDVTPEPASLILFGTGMLGIMALARRKRRS